MTKSSIRNRNAVSELYFETCRKNKSPSCALLPHVVKITSLLLIIFIDTRDSENQIQQILEYTQNQLNKTNMLLFTLDGLDKNE